MIRFFLCTAVLAIISGASFAQAPVSAPVTAAPSPVLLELFTSQGCAFCPPADELMGRMIQQQGIIGLSCHVDYFGVRQNSLGKSFCTRRQSDYNRQIGKGPRYTPQLVVNGQAEVIGYETGKVSAAIMKARAAKTLSIPVTAAGADAYSFSLPDVNAGADPLSLWMVVYDAPKTMAIMEGNNFGRKMTYYNVVSQLNDLGAWDGKAVARAVRVSFEADNAGIAIFAQNMRTGKIIAVGKAVR